MREAFGPAVLEAKVSGFPPAGGLPELIEHRVDGWISTDISADGLARGFEYFVAYPERNMIAAHEWVRDMFRAAGFRITRWRPASRYQAMDETLVLMQSLGFNPRVVIDGGANMGTWSTMARSIFPESRIYMIEPQQECKASLEALCAADLNLVFLPFAMAEPGVETVRMIGGADVGGTGAWVAAPGEEAVGELTCRARTLDDMFAGAISREDRALLKLDIEGYEIPALTGAASLLEDVEAVLTEVQFFEINGNGRPLFADTLEFMRHRGFELYDIACLSQRPRDMRLRMGDVVFVRRDSELMKDVGWE